jgi:hypothetical protein
MQRLIAAVALLVALAAALAGCATPPPPSREMPRLQLAPSALGRSLNLQQHLTLQAPGREQQLDVLLEADSRRVQLGVLAMGQVAARLDWDGKTLKEDKASWWPQAVSGARILSDLQLTLWPVRAIQAALPPGWALADSGDTRTLTQDGEVVTIVRRLGPGVVEIDQQREHFKLRIESRDLGSDAQFLD